ncbi:MAG TPA: hypothetical protein VFZ22_20300 [Pyrinomonadaceae bacterium]|nr:hypothetical protein [Pyrinomonadaceae bacterium]
MLQTLKNRPPQDVAAILAGLTLSLFPPEETQGTCVTPVNEPLRNKVLSEVYEKLKLSPSDQSEAGKAELLEYLAKEMSRAALSNADIEEIKERVGQRGDLRPGLYKIKIPDDARKLAAERFISIGEIRDAVERPDEVEHLLPERFGVNGEAVSLYSQKWVTEKSGELSQLLVLTRRKGYKQTVLDVIRVYESDVDLSNATTPLEMLRAFIEVYGQVQQIGERAEKFFLYETIPFVGNHADVIKLPTEPEGETTISKFFCKFSFTSVEVAIAYTILERKYRSDLRKHK